MRGIAILVILVLSICRAVVLNAQGAPARIALLIGNQAYVDKVGALKNPHRDVARVAASLKRLGFRVTVVKDAGYRAMDGAVRRYVDRVRRAGPGAISFFYYSGHGAANPDNQVNYLIPIDATSADTSDLWYQSFEQSGIIDKLSRQAPQATHFVVFDACRNELNVSGALKKGLGDEKGFVPVNDVRGMLIAYATGEKRTASDSGKFAEILAEELLKKGVEAVELFRRVQIRVQKLLGQEPWMSLRYLPPVYLAGVPEETVVPEPQDRDADTEAEREWAAVDKNSVAMLETFLQRHGKSRHAVYALAQLDELKRTQTNKIREPSLSEAARTWSKIMLSNKQSVLRTFIRQHPNTTQAKLARERLRTVQTAIPMWGAVARKRGTWWRGPYVPNKYIWVSRFASEDTARKEVLKQCEAIEEGWACKLIAVFKNSCFAVYGSQSGYGSAVKDTVEMAKLYADASCRSHKENDNCTLALTGCSDGEAE